MSDAGSIPATFLDGRVARRRVVALEAGNRALVIVSEGEVLATWDAESLLRVESAGDRLWLTSSAQPEARLELTGEAAQRVAAAYPCLEAPNREWGGTARIIGWSAAAAASLVLTAIYLVPVLAGRLVPLIPPRLEWRLGEAVDVQLRRQLDGGVCEVEAGADALAVLVRKVAAAAGLAEGPDGVRVVVLGSRSANAIALPGGRVYLLEGLLQRAESPDEVAGVLAHEFGHVVQRDGLRKFIQAGGTSFLLGLLFGDVGGASTLIIAGRALVDNAYSRDAERDADRFAVETMRALGRPSHPMGLLLQRMGEGGSGLLSSHPLTDERLEMLRGGVLGTTGEPLLTPPQWGQLKAICGKP